MGHVSLALTLALDGLTLIGEDGHLVGIDLETRILVTH